MTEVRRIGPDGAFLREFTEVLGRVKSLETKPAGNIVVRETIKTTDPVTGVDTIMGQLPDGSFGIQPFINDTTPPPVPTTPIVVTQSGTVIATWSGTFVAGALAPRDFQFCRIYAQRQSDHVIALLGSVTNTNDSAVSGADIVAGGEVWTFWATSVDYNGNESAASVSTAPITIASVLDDTGLADALANNQTQINAANTAVATKNTVFKQATAPTANKINDTWFDTSNGNKPMTWNGSAWVSVQDASIATAQTSADAAQTTANSKTKTFTQSATPTATTVGDIWIDTANGNVIKIWDGSTWVNRADAAIAAAQAAANTAQTSANGKNTNISAASAPATAGHINGDLWFDTSNGNKPMVFSTNTWVSAQDASIAAAQTAANTAQTTANGKNTAFYQTTSPSTSGRVTGDLWFDTGNGYRLSVWNGTAWTLSQDASIAAAQTTANTKTKTFIQGTTPTATTVGDIWIDTSNGNVIKTWEGSSWVNRADAAIATAQTAANTAQTSANGKNTVFYQTTAPSTSGRVTGDTWFDTANGYRISVWNGAAWTLSQDASIATAQTAANTAQTTANSKTKTFIQSTSPTATTIGDIWIDTANGNVIKTWEGSSWITRADAAIAAAQTSANTAQTTANGKNTIISAASAPATAGHIAGDIWFDTSNGNKPMVLSGTAWISAQDASIATAQSAANAAQTTANGKNTVISSASAPATAGHINGDIWFDTSNGNKPMIFNTNAWLSAQDASIATAQTAANTAQTTANGKNTVTYSASAASGSGSRTGDVWFQTNGSNIVIGQWQWSGSAWVQQTIDNAVIANLDAGKLTAGSIAAARIAAGTIVSSMIATDTITAGNIAAGAVTASELAAGSVQAFHLTANSISATAMVANTITAGQIAANTITATQIAANTITASQIAADTITAAQIAADSITSSELAAGSITAAKGQISDLAVTTAKINDAAITTAKIANLAVTNAQIADATIQSAKIGSVDAGTITVGTLSAARIGANTITSSKMIISDMEEMIPNPLFHPNGEPVTSSSVILSSSTPVSAGAPFPYVYQLNTRDNHPFINTPNVAVKDGDQFYLEVWVAAAPTAIRNFNLYMFGSTVPVGGLTAKTSTGNLAPTQTWTKITWNYTVPTAAGFNYIKPVLQINTAGGETAPQLAWYATGWSMKRKNTGSLIVDGAIQAGSAIIGTGAIGTAQIANLAVTNAQIADAAITNAKINDLDAGKITAGFISAARLQATDIQAKFIAAGTVSASAIVTPGTITAASGIIGSLDAGTITVGTLSGARIGANTITADKLLIGSTDNIISEPTFTNSGASWNNLGSGISIDATGSRNSGPALKIVNSASQQATYNLPLDLPVEAGSAFLGSFWIKSDVTIPANGLTLGNRFKLVDGSFTYPGFYTNAGTIAANTWTRLSGKVTAPANAKSMSTYIASQAVYSTGNLWVDFVSVVRASTGELIVDGAIQAGSAIIGTGAIGSAQIGSVDAGTINAGFINAARLQASDIQTKFLAAGTVSASAIITPGTITAASGVIGSLDAGSITSGTVSTTRLDATSIRAAVLNVGKITAADMVTNTITAASGIIQDINADKITSGTINASYIAVGSGTNALSDPGFNSTPLTTARTAQSTGGTGGWTIAAGTSTGLRKATRTTSSTSDAFAYLTMPHTYANAGQLIPVVAGQIWTLKCDTTTSVSAANVTFQAYTASADGTVATTAITSVSANSTSQRPVTASYTVPAGVTGFMIGLKCDTTGVTWTVHGNAYVGQQVTGDLLVNGAIDGKTITGATIQTASSGARIVMDATSLNAWDASNNNYFTLSNTGGVSIAGKGTNITRTRTNYAGWDCSFEQGMGNWGAASGTTTFARDTAQAYIGTYSGKVTDTVTRDRSAFVTTNMGSTAQPHTFSVYVRHNAAVARSFRVDTTYQDSTFTQIGSVLTGSSVSVSANTWTRLTVTANPSVSTSRIVSTVVGIGMQSTETYWVDAVMFEQSSTATSFFDGYTAPTGQYTYQTLVTSDLAVSAESLVKNVTIKAGSNALWNPGNLTQALPGIGFVLDTPFAQTAGIFSDGTSVSIIEGSGGGAGGGRVDVGDQGGQHVSVYGWNGVSVTGRNGVVIDGQVGGTSIPGTVTVNGSLMASKHVELTSLNFTVAGSNQAWDIGPLTVDTANSTANYATIAAAGPFSGSVKVLESGYYSFACWHAPLGSCGTSMLRAWRGSDGRNLAQVNNAGYYWENSVTTPVVYVAANDYIRFQVQYATGANANSRVFVQKHVF